MQQLTQYLPYITAAAAIVGAWKFYQWQHDHHTVFDTFKKGELEKFKIRTDLFANYFQNKQGLVIHVRRYLVPNPIGLIFLCHGFTEHSGRYEGTILELNKLGYTVLAIDHQGHGGSSGDRSFVGQFEDYVDDVIQWMNYEWDNMKHSRFQWSLPFFTIPNASDEKSAKMQQLAQNIFVFGHSMGGLISVRTALAIKTNPERVPFIPLQTHPIRLILSAPALALDKELTDVPIIITLSKFLSVVVPKAIVQNMPDKPISTISAVHDMTIRDPVVNEPTVTARFGAEFIGSIEFAVKHVKEFDFPIFLMQSYADNVVDGYGVKKWFDCISTKPENATFCEVKGFHEILFDVDRETLLTGIANFLTKHTQ